MTMQFTHGSYCLTLTSLTSHTEARKAKEAAEGKYCHNAIHRAGLTVLTHIHHRGSSAGRGRGQAQARRLVPLANHDDDGSLFPLIVTRWLSRLTLHSGAEPGLQMAHARCWA